MNRTNERETKRMNKHKSRIQFSTSPGSFFFIEESSGRIIQRFLKKEDNYKYMQPKDSEKEPKNRNLQKNKQTQTNTHN